ncbi:MAG: NAD(P)/FAD-dependent oxidoreductase [Candidatus Dormibacteria bacterium]
MPRPELGMPAGVNVLVIGAGAIGCSVAFNLAQAGVKNILVLDRGGIGEGSTGRCAGGVRAQFGTEVNVRMGLRSREVLRDFERLLGRPSDFKEIGYLFCASSEELMAGLRANVEMQRGAGLKDVSEVSVAEIQKLVPGLQTADLFGGTFCPSDGIAGPNELTSAYAHASRQAGVRIMEGVEVTGLSLDSTDCRVLTSRGEIRAGQVVCCAGAWSGVIGQWAGVEIPVKPFRRHIFVTKPFDAITRETPMTVDVRTSFYFHPEGDGALLGMSDPAEPEGFRTEVDWDFLEHLVEHGIERFPALERAEIMTGWAGLYEVTPDHQAIIGAAPGTDRLWLCCGFSGHGFMQAPAAGELTANLMTGEAPPFDVSALRPSRFAEGDYLRETAVI